MWLWVGVGSVSPSGEAGSQGIRGKQGGTIGRGRCRDAWVGRADVDGHLLASRTGKETVGGQGQGWLWCVFGSAAQVARCSRCVRRARALMDEVWCGCELSGLGETGARSLCEAWRVVRAIRSPCPPRWRRCWFNGRAAVEGVREEQLTPSYASSVLPSRSQSMAP